MPDRTLTPGNALVLAAAVVCAPGYATSISDVSEDFRRGVLAAYAIEDAQRDGYELDHLIPVELGGDNAAAQPVAATAHRYVATLERRLG